MKNVLRAVLTLALSGSVVASAAPAPSRIILDGQGVMRWRASGQEVTLFGANYCAFSAGDYRLAVRVGADMKSLIDADMGHFARMGWDGLRLCTWGDWESSDAQGNRVDNINMQLMDYLIFKARERGMEMLLTPIHTYGSGYADQMNNPDFKPGGFSSVYERKVMGTEPKSIAAQVNYIGQVLDHVNPYTKLALKDDPNILFVEMINEPVHHPQDGAKAVQYIDTLVDAVRATGSKQITFHNFSQDFAIADALAKSKVQGIDFGWYPSGLVTGHTQQGNFLHAVDGYPDLLNPKLLNKPRIVYEFDQGDLNTGYMYPAMARTLRSVGAQFAAIFAYDMLATAPYNLSWQTHFINLVHTPRKAVSAVIAGEAMRRLPRMRAYGSYPDSTRFGDFAVDYDSDSSLLNASDAFMHAGDTTSAPKRPAALKRVVGFGSSPLVAYEGTGAYFLDKVRDGVWRLEVYPSAILTSDPFAQPQPGKVVSRLYFDAWPMTIKLPDLGAGFMATPLTVPANGAAAARAAAGGSVTIEPGVWLLSRASSVDMATLPARINRVGMREYHVNPPQAYPDLVQTLAPREFVAGGPATIRVRLASPHGGGAPTQLQLYLRAAGSHFGKPIPFTRVRGYEYAASIDAAQLPEGLYEYVVVQGDGANAVTFPGAVAGQPGRWPFDAATGEVWRFTVTAAERPLEIFNPARDLHAMSWVRPSEEERSPGYRLLPGETSDTAALSLFVPKLKLAATQDSYSGALYIGDRIAARGAAAARANALDVRLKGGKLEVLLIEKDGSSWSGSVEAGADWHTQTIALETLRFARSALTPTPYPGTWNYWRQGPAARAAGRIRPAQIERIELRVSGSDGAVEIGSVRLRF